MAHTKPLILVTTGTIPHPYDATVQMCALPDPYIAAIEAAGGIGVVLHPTTDKIVLKELAGRCEGLLIAGGGDINPKLYRDIKKGNTGEYYNMSINDTRDEMELFLYAAFKKAKKPILGICRGCQMIAVAEGGTLTQHIGGHFTKPEDGLWHTKAHLVQCNGETISVNSVHHQAIATVGKKTRIFAKTVDGIIEGVVVQSRAPIIGVQWHPEELPEEQVSKVLFKRLILNA